jgi:hypothetical protein
MYMLVREEHILVKREDVLFPLNCFEERDYVR